MFKLTQTPQLKKQIKLYISRKKKYNKKKKFKKIEKKKVKKKKIIRKKKLFKSTLKPCYGLAVCIMYNNI